MKYTIREFENNYPTDDACLAEVFAQQGGPDRTCDKCRKETIFYKVKKRKSYACKHCGYQIYPLANTIFHKSSTPLKSWFYAMFLFTTSKNGVSAKELERHLGVTYKCAWRIARQLRILMSQDKAPQLKGVVEADETYVGGKGRNNKRGRGAEKKTPVFGMVERDGNVVAYAVPNVKRATVTPIIKHHVAIGTNMMTDEYRIYNKLSTEGYYHRRVQHGTKEYVRGFAHTNTIEGFWSQLKRSIDGTHHSVSSKHLQLYVNEYAWRYNYRHEKNLFPILVDSFGKPS